MNFETTKQLLDVLNPYVDVDNLKIETEGTDWRGKKYKADYVILDEKNQVGFEVTERSIITFCFSDHQHFDNYTADDENDPTYIEWAKEFLLKLFTLPVLYTETYKGKVLLSEKYSFLIDGEEDRFGGSWYGLVRMFNPFAKKSYKTTVWKYDAKIKTFTKVGAK